MKTRLCSPLFRRSPIASRTLVEKPCCARSRRRSRVRIAARRLEPRGGARDVLEAAVQQRDSRRGKRLAKTGLELRCEADFGNQHHGLSAALEHASDAVQVDLRFPGAGDAIEQEGGEGPER